MSVMAARKLRTSLWAEELLTLLPEPGEEREGLHTSGVAPPTTTSAVDDELHQERLVPVQCSRRLVASPRANFPTFSPTAGRYSYFGPLPFRRRRRQEHHR